MSANKDNEAPERIWISPRQAWMYAKSEGLRDPCDTEKYARVDPSAGTVPCKALGYSYDNPPPRDKQWCVTHGQSMGSCAAMIKVAERDAELAHRKLATLIAERLFTCGDGTKADRLLLIQEDYSGAAKVSNGRYLAGWSKPPVIDAIADAIQSAAKQKGE